MKTLIAGTFDNFHIGHQHYVWSGYTHSSELHIIIARDNTVFKIKGKKPRNSEVKRYERVIYEFTHFENVEVRLGRADQNFFKTIEEVAPERILLGYDQQFNLENFANTFPNILVERAQPYSPEFFKSSKF